MITTWAYAIASVLVVSLVSLIGIFTLAIKEKRLRRIIIYLVSLSAGALLGGAFIHLIPEGIEAYDSSIFFFMLILAGMLLFFILEKAIIWHHCHDEGCEAHHPKTAGPMIMIGDGLHNLIDGMIIGGSFLVSVPLGMTTTIAMIIHEIPQEIGDFGVLIHGGYSKRKALFLNFMSGLVALAGTIIALAIGSSSEAFMKMIIPFAAGGFIYIAASDLIPELHKVYKVSTSIWQIILFIMGIAAMFLLKFII